MAANIEYVDGDLLVFKTDIIVQQCNCLTITSHGLSKTIADKYPEADIYKNRHRIGNRNLSVVADRGVPGTCILTEITSNNDSNCRYVASILGQWRPSKVTTSYSNIYPESIPRETMKQREIWFQKGLIDLETKLSEKSSQNELNNCNSIAFPYLIGCGLAGGNWENFLHYIEEFANRNPKLTIYIVKLPSCH